MKHARFPMPSRIGEGSRFRAKLHSTNPGPIQAKKQTQAVHSHAPDPARSPAVVNTRSSITATMVFLTRMTIINLREITLALESGKSTLPTQCNTLLLSLTLRLTVQVRMIK
jgi:hypothetical protein